MNPDDLKSPYFKQNIAFSQAFLDVFSYGLHSYSHDLQTVEGFTRYGDGSLLYLLATMTKGDIVEIGCYKGRSSCWLAYAIRDSKLNRKLYCIDKFDNFKDIGGKTSFYDDFCFNLKDRGLFRFVNPLVMSSHDASELITTPISLLFIDGSHEYEDVKKDFNLYCDKVVKGGFIIIDDAGEDGWEGPKRFFNEFLKDNKLFYHYYFHNMAVMEKLY